VSRSDPVAGALVRRRLDLPCAGRNRCTRAHVRRTRRQRARGLNRTQEVAGLSPATFTRRTRAAAGPRLVRHCRVLSFHHSHHERRTWRNVVSIPAITGRARLRRRGPAVVSTGLDDGDGTPPRPGRSHPRGNRGPSRAVVNDTNDSRLGQCRLARADWRVGQARRRGSPHPVEGAGRVRSLLRDPPRCPQGATARRAPTARGERRGDPQGGRAERADVASLGGCCTYERAFGARDAVRAARPPARCRRWRGDLRPGHQRTSVQTSPSSGGPSPIATVSSSCLVRPSLSSWTNSRSTIETPTSARRRRASSHGSRAIARGGS
jgi:hypothetical protein